MAEFRTIEVDFDVHKRIELARRNFSETPNEVLRRLLRIDISETVASECAAMTTRPWSGKGVVLPHDTQIRMDYNGRTHEGEIFDGSWLVEGKRFSSPSAAAGSVARTKNGNRTNLDGWKYWSVQLPGEPNWRKLSEMRKSDQSKSATVTSDEGASFEVNLPNTSAADLPTESQVKGALEALLRKTQRSLTPSEAYKALADEFGLNAEQRNRVMPNEKRCHWENRVRFARRKLVDAGIMAGAPRGRWGLAKL